MRSLLLQVLLLLVTLKNVHSRCEDRPSPDERVNALQRLILKRYSDLDYDSFVGLMGKRSSDAEDEESLEKREMHDIFVGLMGRRNSEPDEAPRRRDVGERRSVYLNKCRLRFLQGL